jgi:cyclopropane fatty-acyl-phospholipid synthase-like methyltransferase
MFGPIFKRRVAITLGTQTPSATGAAPLIQVSHALPRLARRLSAADHPWILDLGSVVGGNLQFFIDLGCKVTADDLLRPVETVLPDSAEKAGADWKEAAAKRLVYPADSFDAVLAWDYIDFLGPGEARDFSRDLRRIVKPGGIVMAYFTSRQTERREPIRRFRILATDRIEWTPLGVSRSLRHVHQNRDIERMFEGFKTHFAVVMRNGSREILLEKKAGAQASSARSRAPG